jgi:hypothetical protein
VTQQSFAETLLAAADAVDDLSRSDIQILLRRAALRIENRTQQAGTTVLDADTTQAIDAWAAASGMSRDEAVNTAIRDWAIAIGLVEPDLTGEGE